MSFTTPSTCGPGSRTTSADLLRLRGEGSLHRIGASYHKVSGFFWKADRKKQRQFVRKDRRQRREAGPKTRRYFVDACHPVWGLELLDCCWLLVGQRHYVGVGSGRKRLNIWGPTALIITTMWTSA